MDYQNWYRMANSIEELENKPFIEHVCFYYLKDNNGYKEPNKFLEVRFRNLFGFKNIVKWFNLFLFEDKTYSFKIDKEYYYVILDMDLLSYEWMLSLLTLYRYPGEYYNICKNTFFLMEEFEKDKWKALFLSHQLEFIQDHNYYNSEHALFYTGNPYYNFDINEVITSLDKTIPYNSNLKYDYRSIQAIWLKKGEYGNKIMFDNTFKEKYKCIITD